MSNTSATCMTICKAVLAQIASRMPPAESNVVAASDEQRNALVKTEIITETVTCDVLRPIDKLPIGPAVDRITEKIKGRTKFFVPQIPPAIAGNVVSSEVCVALRRGAESDPMPLSARVSILYDVENDEASIRIDLAVEAQNEGASGVLPGGA